ncbi:MAG TPA: glycosyltransferase, partial [Nannocystaceae bacterium]|nr:glycosyltransferase [Nannocystaceae bacterium]
MRILVVSTSIRVPGTHGGSTHVSELVAALRAHAPTMLVARAGSKGPDVVGVGVLKRTAPAGLRHGTAALHAGLALARARAFAPDVIYERGASYGAGAMLSAVLKVPMITMVLDEHVSPISLARASRLIATDLGVVPARYRHKAVRVSWGANVERFRPDVDGSAVRARHGLDGAFVVGYSGTFRAWHGLPTLVDAAARLGGRKVRFFLVGEGPERAALERSIAAAGLGDRFVFAGRVPYEAMPEHMAAMDVVAAPFDPDRHDLSRTRGFTLDPLKVFESVAMARPTFTIDAANIRALFGDDGVHLRYAPARDGEALARLIAWAQDEPAAAQAMAERGALKVAREHTWAAHGAHLVQIFEELLAEQREGR